MVGGGGAGVGLALWESPIKHHFPCHSSPRPLPHAVTKLGCFTSGMRGQGGQGYLSSIIILGNKVKLRAVSHVYQLVGLCPREGEGTLSPQPLAQFRGQRSRCFGDFVPEEVTR